MKIQKWYKINEIAEMTGITSNYIRKSILNQELEAIKTGKIYRVSIDNFNDFINKIKFSKAQKKQKLIINSNYLKNLNNNNVISDIDKINNLLNA